MTNKHDEEVVKRFDEEFPNSRSIFENNDPYDTRRNAIKDFILQELHTKEEVVREKAKELFSAMISDLVKENKHIDIKIPESYKDIYDFLSPTKPRKVDYK